ncbi:salicylate hydroxylase [Streptomyces spiralis]|uniref:Salicylate hydroxylase n=2 Tax=Streptomyces spiralis TaxID=66376 RepID=A0A919AHI4_9ACTN|nr:salicylate hydroxylase [Streptomyces spiralis]
MSGLALAKSPLDRGLPVDVVKRRAEDEQAALGAGLYLPAKTVRALPSIGVGDAVAELAEPVSRQRLHDHRGRLLAEFGVDRTGAMSVLDWRSQTVAFADGTTEAHDLVVGADGIDSAVRRSLFGGPAPRFLGQLCWRFIAEDVTSGITDWTAHLGTKGRTSLTVQLGAGRVYCYADINSPVPAAPAGDRRTLFADFGGPVPRLLETGRDAHFAALRESVNRVWTRPGVALVSDAAISLSSARPALTGVAGGGGTDRPGGVPPLPSPGIVEPVGHRKRATPRHEVSPSAPVRPVAVRTALAAVGSGEVVLHL